MSKLFLVSVTKKLDHLKNKTVSKWECGLGCPDLSLWPELSTILGVDMKQMMEGEITSNTFLRLSFLWKYFGEHRKCLYLLLRKKVRTYLAYCCNYCTKNHGRGNRY